MNTIQEQFETAGNQASYHYADDSGREWGSGHAAKAVAMQLYWDNPELQAELAEIAKGFLWSLPHELRIKEALTS